MSWAGVPVDFLRWHGAKDTLRLTATHSTPEDTEDGQTGGVNCARPARFDLPCLAIFIVRWQGRGVVSCRTRWCFRSFWIEAGPRSSDSHAGPKGNMRGRALASLLACPVCRPNLGHVCQKVGNRCTDRRPDCSSLGTSGLPECSQVHHQRVRLVRDMREPGKDRVWI